MSTSRAKNASFAQCEPGGYAALLYDVADDTWRSIAVPDELSALEAEDAVATAVGRLGNGVLVTAGDAIWAWDATSEWRRLPEPPLAWRHVCPYKDGVVAVGWEDETGLDGAAPGDVEGGDQSAASDVRVASVLGDAAGNEWSAPVTASGDQPIPLAVEAVCTGAGVVTIAASSSPGTGTPKFLPDDGAWVALPAPSPDPGYGAAKVAVGEKVVLLGDVNGAVLDTAGDAGSWRAMELPGGARPEAIAADGSQVYVLVRQADAALRLMTVDA